MRSLDLATLLLYLGAVVALGAAFFRRDRSVRDFTIAGGRMHGWVVGLSLFATFLSSNTFLGVPGKAFSEDWNSFVFSLSLLPAALIASRLFIPFFRNSGTISAYEHLEERFGTWARLYATICYLLTQLARTGTILFGVSLGLQALTGWPLPMLIVATGALVTAYTLLGGIEAVIWTDVLQSVVLFVGAIVIALVLVGDLPGGLAGALERAAAEGKTSLGSFGPDVTTSTFWVVLLYGFFINLNNFGIDQSYVQRYHAAADEREARGSVWLAALLYLPISWLFFLIGTLLWDFYGHHPALLEGKGADQALPHFISTQLPAGLAGVLIAALVAAAMSSLDTSLNSSATVLYEDFYRRFRPTHSQSSALRFLYSTTFATGALGTGAALMMIGVESLLDAWWTLSGIFAGGMLGLFLLGLLARRSRSADAAVGVAVGVVVILWMTAADRLPDALRSPLHANLIIVVGTLTIFAVGVASRALRSRT